MNIYTYKDKLIFTPHNMEDKFEKAKEEALKTFNDTVFYIENKDAKAFRRCFKISDPNFLENPKEDLTLLKKSVSHKNSNIPAVLLKAIEDNRAVYVNSAYGNWMDVITKSLEPKKWNITVVGLGDVGGTLITGLRLLGGDCIKSIGIFDKDINKVNRWCYEANAILDINSPEMPIVRALEEEELFNCDMFVFCVSVGVPEVGKEQKDVRLIQFEGNSKIVAYYAKKAREANFKGVFAVVSDPVDLLCKVAFNESNKDESGNFDFKGLGSDQVRGYGLGVMNARANYFSLLDERTKNYSVEGRAFGPHGEGLIIANSMENFDEELSLMLTEKTKKANLDVRATGFKPYIAPALSSGSISLMATIKGQWHYSANFIGGTFIGCKNRYSPYGTEFETYDFPKALYENLQKTYDYLNSIYK